MSNKSVFEDLVQQQVAIGTPVSSISVPGINVESFTNGVVLRRNDEETTLDLSTGILRTRDGQKVTLATTNSGGEMDAFKRHSQGAFAFGQTFRDDTGALSVSATSRKTLVLFGDDQGSALLVSNFDDGTRGIALFHNGLLSAGEIKAPGPAHEIGQVLDRDLSPLLPTRA